MNNDKPITTLYMLMSVDGKISTGANDELDVDKDFPTIKGLKDGASTYILKYSRKSNEPRESSYDKELIKSKHCLFMIEFKLMQGKKEKYLLIYCHEIAAIYFDAIYERIKRNLLKGKKNSKERKAYIGRNRGKQEGKEKLIISWNKNR